MTHDDEHHERRAPSHVAPASPIIERVLRIIDEGRRTSTYKLALLAALIDVAATQPEDPRVPTRALAERVLESYFDQARPYVGANGEPRELKQISTPKGSLADVALDLRRLADQKNISSASRVRTELKPDYASALNTVETTLVRYPIRLLQSVGGSDIPFLYDVDWTKNTSPASLRAAGQDHLELRAGVAEQLIVFGPLLRPLIQLHWRNDVAKWSAIGTEEQLLDAHLFGADRVAMKSSTRDALIDLQEGRCFYCEGPLGKKVEIDHFVAWSRWPNNAIENLVAADKCNSAKSDHIAAHEHALRWDQHVAARSSDLATIATDTHWDTDLDRSRALARSTYSVIAQGTPLWVKGRDFRVEGPLSL